MHDAQRTSRSLDSQMRDSSHIGLERVTTYSCLRRDFLSAISGNRTGGWASQAAGSDRLGWRLHRCSGRTSDTGLRPELCELPHAHISGEQQQTTCRPDWEGFAQKTVGDLLTYVKTSMPNGNGGSLAAATYNDLVALILKSNGFPAGTTDLGPETVADVNHSEGGSRRAAIGIRSSSGGLSVEKRQRLGMSERHDTPSGIERAGVGPADASRPLGTRTATLKFVLTRLDPFVGQRLSVGRRGS